MSSVSLPRPRLRGWLHAAAAPVAAVGTVVLWFSSTTPAARVTATIFGASLAGLYVASSLYHVAPWRGRIHQVLGRIDAAMIVLTIVGTFTPIGYHALDGTWRSISLTVAWVIAAVAISLIVAGISLPRWARGGWAIAVGWLAVVPLTRIAEALPATATGLIAVGGLLYTLGAIAYITQRPNPLPRWFGFHEVFHLCVVAASALHWVAIYRYVLPT